MAGLFKIDQTTRDRLIQSWPEFSQRRQRLLDCRDAGRVLHEKDMEELFRCLAEGPLGYRLDHLCPQQDYADYALIDRGLKLAVVEVKRLGYLAGGRPDLLEEVLRQAARYAHRHRVPYLMAFDGQTLALARWNRAERSVHCALVIDVGRPEPPDELYYFTHYGIFRVLPEVRYSFLFDPGSDDGPLKTHHGTPLPHFCFAYVGDLRNKATWKMPYRNPDGSVDTKRLGHAVNYLFSPGGYRGQKAEAESIPIAATALVALRLAGAYKELGLWRAPVAPFCQGEKCSPQELLWTYLYQLGLEGEP